ncbi:MAG: hypothetical protein K9K38_09100 [Rhodoferax sp.]|nr:hypothetical protein [Rhodoferax sp.]
MTNYDPANQPDPAEWLALDEQERIGLVQDYHRTEQIKLPNAKVDPSVKTIFQLI